MYPYQQIDQSKKEQSNQNKCPLELTEKRSSHVKHFISYFINSEYQHYIH